MVLSEVTTVKSAESFPGFVVIVADSLTVIVAALAPIELFSASENVVELENVGGVASGTS